MENFDSQIVEEIVETTPNAPHAFNEHEKSLMTQACNYLYSISKWMKFFFVLMIISIVFLAVCGIMFIVTSTFFNAIDSEADAMTFPLWIAGVIYIIMAAVYVVPTIYLKRIYTAADQAMNGNDNEAMVEFLKNNKSLWKFFGILTIVMFGLSILVLPVVMALTSLA